jgi:hypothetical protein
MTQSTIRVIWSSHDATQDAHLAAVAFLGGYRGRTLDAYRHDLRGLSHDSLSISGLGVRQRRCARGHHRGLERSTCLQSKSSCDGAKSRLMRCPGDLFRRVWREDRSVLQGFPYGTYVVHL